MCKHTRKKRLKDLYWKSFLQFSTTVFQGTISYLLKVPFLSKQVTCDFQYYKISEVGYKLVYFFGLCNRSSFTYNTHFLLLLIPDKRDCYRVNNPVP